jgi:hypothetical protein
MPFETFTRRMIPLVSQPYVTLQKRGTISMNKAAHHLLGAPEAVELLYDRDASIIGFRAVDPKMEHAYAIRAMGSRKEESGTYMVSGIAFFKYYKIDTAEARRYAVTLNDDGILVLDLNQRGTIVTSNRSGTGKDASGDVVEDAAPE